MSINKYVHKISREHKFLTYEGRTREIYFIKDDSRFSVWKSSMTTGTFEIGWFESYIIFVYAKLRDFFLGVAIYNIITFSVIMLCYKQKFSSFESASGE